MDNMAAGTARSSSCSTRILRALPGADLRGRPILCAQRGAIQRGSQLNMGELQTGEKKTVTKPFECPKRLVEAGVQGRNQNQNPAGDIGLRTGVCSSQRLSRECFGRPIVRERSQGFVRPARSSTASQLSDAALS